MLKRKTLYILFGILYGVLLTSVLFAYSPKFEVTPNQTSTNRNRNTDYSLTIVTAASSNHLRPLTGLLNSIKEFHNDARIVFYDLGLIPEESEIVRPWLENHGYLYRIFDFSKYPDYFNINDQVGQWAWKPVIVKEVVDEFGLTLWLDAGDRIVAPLDPFINIIKRDGFASIESRGVIETWTHPKMLDYFYFPNELLYETNCNAAVIGWSRDHKNAYRMLTRWEECARTKECIAPEGSSRQNHRQDQAALSVLAYLHNLEKSCNNYFWKDSVNKMIVTHQDKNKDEKYYSKLWE